MFGHKKSPLHRFSKHKSADQVPSNFRSNPFDDDSLVNNQTLEPSRRTSSDPSLVTPNSRMKLFDDDEIKGTSSYKNSITSAERNRYRNDFHDSGGFEAQSVQELENYSVYKAEETTKTVNNCLKIAEDIREDATKTLVTLHQQGEQITRTHMVAADMDHDLTRGEKLLGSLGGIFSKTWKPKKGRPITGPVITRDDPVHRKGNHLEQRERLGLTSATKERTTRTLPPEPTNAFQKVEALPEQTIRMIQWFGHEVEKVKQDDAFSDLSNILGQLKDMAIDMGSEIERQNKALDPLENDVEELVVRVKGANQRGRRLLGK